MTIHGLIVAAKEKGMTSHEVVQKIRHLFHTKRVGHFGTLDPAATGVLLVGLGHVTRFFNFYICKEKLYTGTIRFGFSTTTYDSEGEPTSVQKEIDLHTIDIHTLLARFTGTITQTPPPYSAKKFKGKPLYTYARKNIAVEPAPTKVQIHKLEGRILDPRTLQFSALTSSGTYIRSLAHEIGRMAGVGAHLCELTRQRIGEFELHNAFKLEQIAVCLDTHALEKVVKPFETLLPEFSKIIVSAGGKRAICNGMALGPADILRIFPAKNADLEHFRIFDEEGNFLAIAIKDSRTQTFKPEIVFPDT